MRRGQHGEDDPRKGQQKPAYRPRQVFGMGGGEGALRFSERGGGLLFAVFVFCLLV